MSLWALWLIVVILLTIIEAMTINLVTIWFVASGIIAMIISFFTSDLVIQFAIFVVGGALLMLLTKPLLEKLKEEKNEKLNLERIIGMTGIVTEEIKKNVVGEVKVDGKRWSAISEKKIAIDSEVLVEAIEGVKLLVVKKEDPKKKEETKSTVKKRTTAAKKKTTTKTTSKKKTTTVKKKEKGDEE